MIETIEVLTDDRVAWLAAEFARLAYTKPDGYFRQCFDAQTRGDLVLLVARTGEQLHGYLKVVWRPNYPPFRDADIPEIQDLNVVPDSRRQGVATRLMDTAERLVAERFPVIGIGFGLHPGYAAAQRMYVLRGYVPDAQPLTYKDEFVTEGQQVRLDDALVLHLTKNLEGERENLRDTGEICRSG
jgi:GNAT superfamily N-acetyltransferase